MSFLSKGAMRKLWVAAKGGVQKNKEATDEQKKYLAANFKIDLGPTLDDFENLLAKGPGPKLTEMHKKAKGIVEVYIKNLKAAKGSKKMHPNDVDDLVECLQTIDKNLDNMLVRASDQNGRLAEKQQAESSKPKKTGGTPQPSMLQKLAVSNKK